MTLTATILPLDSSFQEKVSVHKGLTHEEPLIFEQNTENLCGVDWPDISLKENALNGLIRETIGLPGMSEPQVIRHYTRLSQKNYGVDTGMYPLGSCTMKHNPRLSEKVARLFCDIHPLQPISTVQGALQVIEAFAYWLTTLTGLPAVALSPAAGAHGELCGMMIIKAALQARGEHRSIVMIPESAHGTNPATAAACGFDVKTIPSQKNGRLDFKVFESLLSKDVAALMLTNPNTCGLFEKDILTISQRLHNVGAFFYCDGANFNALVGKVRPFDLGIDCMHINLHKTFSTPHGGGGPGSGPVVLCQELAPFAPLPFVVRKQDTLTLVETFEEAPQSIGRLKGFHGQMGIFTRALCYMMSHGADGLKQVAEDAVLNANYLFYHLKDTLTAPYEGRCMHEALFDDRFLKGTGITTLDFSKALIDEGYHPMTMYFPLIVSGALLIEPTETESLSTLDHFIDVIKKLSRKAKNKNVDFFKQAPVSTPRRRLNETQAAKNPILRA
ncbi:MAG: aminomethyl-transferring glycine dehydrogenase subunit GcvPB [Proteobacteria bacterium]|nr:aminomethyl-transferring glycine dehydrogenase subunit GcvPB [Pseudomonadota bacterium]